jgi:hypothetical protein
MMASILRTAVGRTLLATATLTILAGCDSAPTSTRDSDAEIALGTYAAQVTGGAGTVLLSGTAEASQNTDAAAFAGTFESYPLGRGENAGFHFTHIRLRTGDGVGLVLGHVSPNAALPNGTFGIEAGRDLSPPFDFVARYFERTRDGRLQQVAARDGRVTVTSGNGRMGGNFELTLIDGRVITGRFAAVTGR